MEARVTAYSQSHRLRERMAEADVHHGEEVRADVRGVRVQLASPAWIGRRDVVKGDVFFCTMGPLEVRRVSVEGDGGPLPDRAILDGLRVPVEGTYDLINVLIRSNGDLRLIVDEASRVEAAPRGSAQQAAALAQ
jgi:hypothetical protein